MLARRCRLDRGAPAWADPAAHRPGWRGRGRVRVRVRVSVRVRVRVRVRARARARARARVRATWAAESG